MLEIPSLPHLLMVLVIVMLLFGANKIPEIGGSIGKGIREFNKGMRDTSLDQIPEQPRDDRPLPMVRDTIDRVEQETPREPKRLL